MARVIGVGDNVVDRYPGLGVCFPGGNALNVAVFARRQGAVAAYVGWLGTDGAGRHIRQVLQQEEVDVSRVRMIEGSNAYDVVELSDGERNFVGSSRGVAASFALAGGDVAFVRGFDVIHTSVYSRTEPHLRALREACGTLSFDYSSLQKLPRGYLEATLPCVDIACISVGTLPLGEIRALHNTIAGRGPRTTIVMRGAAGAVLYRDGEEIVVPAAPAEVVDTLGAGDAFIATCLVGLVERHEPRGILSSASAEAARTCASHGAFGYPLDISAI